jgi:hypothetical protein
MTAWAPAPCAVPARARPAERSRPQSGPAGNYTPFTFRRDRATGGSRRSPLLVVACGIHVIGSANVHTLDSLGRGR